MVVYYVCTKEIDKSVIAQVAFVIAIESGSESGRTSHFLNLPSATVKSLTSGSHSPSLRGSTGTFVFEGNSQYIVHKLSELKTICRFRETVQRHELHWGEGFGGGVFWNLRINSYLSLNFDDSYLRQQYTTCHGFHFLCSAAIGPSRTEVTRAVR